MRPPRSAPRHAKIPCVYPRPVILGVPKTQIPFSLDTYPAGVEREVSLGRLHPRPSNQLLLFFFFPHLKTATNSYSTKVPILSFSSKRGKSTGRSSLPGTQGVRKEERAPASLLLGSYSVLLGGPKPCQSSEKNISKLWSREGPLLKSAVRGRKVACTWYPVWCSWQAAW